MDEKNNLIDYLFIGENKKTNGIPHWFSFNKNPDLKLMLSFNVFFDGIEVKNFLSLQNIDSVGRSYRTIEKGEILKFEERPALCNYSVYLRIFKLGNFDLMVNKLQI